MTGSWRRLLGRARSLRFVAPALATLLVVLSTGLSLVLGGRFARRENEGEARAKIEEIGSILADEIQRDARLGDWRHVQSAIASRSLFREIDFVALLDRGSVVLSSTRLGLVGRRFDPAAAGGDRLERERLAAMLGEGRGAGGSATVLLSPTRLGGVFPVPLPGALPGLSGAPSEGRVVIVFDFSDNLRQELAAHRLSVLGQAAIGFGAVVIFALFLEVHVLRRLSRIAEAARGLAKGDFDRRSEVRGGDEVGQLGDTFDRMAAELGDGRRRLEASEERFRALARLAPAGIYMTDPQGRCFWVNDLWCRIAGLSPDEALGEGWVGAIHPDDREMVAAAWSKVVATRGEWQHEYRFVDPSGKATWVYGVAAPQLDERGEVVSWIGVNVDIDGLKRADEERRRLEEQLAQSRKMELVGRLAGGVAHDFNNMLVPIIGNAELLAAECGPDDPRRRDLADIVEAATRARDLTRQLLAFARRQPLDVAVHDLSRVVTGFTGMLRRTIRENVEIETRLAPDPLPLLCDRGQVEQVLLNLAVNAQDAMPRGGRLVLATRREGAAPDGAVLLEVVDTGSGMDSETASRIFEPFFTTKAKGTGTGLGLSIVYGIVAEHGGEISVESAPGVGSTFRLRFPPAPPGATRPPAETAATVPPGAGPRRTVLVVEDEDRVRVLAVRILRRGGFDTLEASGGPEALDLVAKNADRAIDLLLSDVVMPGMAGPELHRRLLEIRPGLPVLFMSGYPDPELSNGGTRIPREALVPKPFGVEQLLAAVRERLAG